MAGVGFHSHELLGQLLIKVNLTSLDDTAVVDRAVLGDGPVGVDLDVDVQGSADLDRFWLVRKLSGCIGGGGRVTYVEARDDAVEGGCSVGVCGPHAAQPGAVVGDKCLVEEGQSCHGLSTTSRFAVRHTLRSCPKVPLMVIFFAAMRSPNDVFGSLPAKEL